MKLESSRHLQPLEVTHTVRDLLIKLPELLKVPYQNVQKACGVDLYKYRNNGSVPTLGFILACLVVRRKLSQEQALKLLCKWEQLKSYLDGRIDEIIEHITKTPLN